MTIEITKEQENEIRNRMKEKQGNYMMGFNMVLGFRNPKYDDVKDAFSAGVEEVLAYITGRSL